MVTFLYLLFVAIIIIIFINIVPKIGSEIENLARSAPRLASAAQDLAIRVESEVGINLGAKDMISGIFNENTIEGMGQQALQYIREA